VHETDGVMDRAYHFQRRSRRSHAYRLQRRGIEVVRAIRDFGLPSQLLLDIGTADGLMVNEVRKALPQLKVVGLDRSRDLLQFADYRTIQPVLADATVLPFPDQSFDLVSAAAVIEHLHQPEALLYECHRILRPDGLCIVTTPDPFFERVATLVGHLPADQHHFRFRLSQLGELMRKSGFEVIRLEKFMISPIGLPLERTLERALRRLRAGWLLLNQISVGRAKG